MIKVIVYVTFFLALSSCVSIPSQHLTISQRGGFSAVQDAKDCEIPQYKTILSSNTATKPELSSKGFRLLTWNMFKGIHKGWQADLKKMITTRDIITIQEARLTDDLRELLNNDHGNWDISIAFTYNGKETGVLTASRVLPDFTCTFRVKEPLFSLPKTAMVTIYPLSDTHKTLMVVNIHSINFIFGTGSFITQLHKAERTMSQHKGPVIFSGDVNTWSKKRMAILKDLSIRLGLKAVPFNKQDRTRIFGRAIDHIYYRELTVIDAAVINVTSSDHNPMLVSFRLEDSG